MTVEDLIGELMHARALTNPMVEVKALDEANPPGIEIVDVRAEGDHIDLIVEVGT